MQHGDVPFVFVTHSNVVPTEHLSLSVKLSSAVLQWPMCIYMLIWLLPYEKWDVFRHLTTGTCLFS